MNPMTDAEFIQSDLFRHEADALAACERLTSAAQRGLGAVNDMRARLAEASAAVDALERLRLIDVATSH
ncbi:MAG: hypothetical protein JNM89_02220 [Hyphomicrobiaceae bacterium]|nr:hypothetical protein [Hyphomicrobiaceae bacterium]